MIRDAGKYEINLHFFVPEALTEPDPSYKPGMFQRITNPRINQMLKYPYLLPCPDGYMVEVSEWYEDTPRAEVMGEESRIIKAATEAGLVLKGETT